MKRTSVPALVGVGGFVAALTFIATGRLYGVMPGVPVAVSATLWVMAIVCVVIAINVRKRKEDGRIGLDRSQLNPVTAAQFLVIGMASAWTGAVIGGLYTGMAAWVAPRVGQLQAASEDLPGVIASALGGVVLAAAGIYLERSCEVDPPKGGTPPSRLFSGVRPWWRRRKRRWPWWRRKWRARQRGRAQAAR